MSAETESVNCVINLRTGERIAMNDFQPHLQNAPKIAGPESTPITEEEPLIYQEFIDMGDVPAIKSTRAIPTRVGKTCWMVR